MSFTGIQKRLAYMKLSQPRSGYRALLTKCCVAFLMLSPLSCGDDADDEDEPKFACYFESITNRDCSGDGGKTATPRSQDSHAISAMERAASNRVTGTFK
mgnify:CR=1 FL=1